jgi:hypothetical protein
VKRAAGVEANTVRLAPARMGNADATAAAVERNSRREMEGVGI